MDPPPVGATTPDNSGAEPSFHKLSTDAAAHRKYRRHCSNAQSDSSSAEDNPERVGSERSQSPGRHKVDHPKVLDRWQRKDERRDLDREASNIRFSRGHRESHRHSDRHSYESSRESKRHDDYRRNHDRYHNEEERLHPRSRSVRESRTGTYSEHTIHDNMSDRSRVNPGNLDDSYAEKSHDAGHRNKKRERDTFRREHGRYDDGEHDRFLDGRKQAHVSRDDRSNRERERRRDGSLEKEKRDHYRLPSASEDLKYPEEKEKSKKNEIIEEEGVLRSKRCKESERRNNSRDVQARMKDEKTSLFTWKQDEKDDKPFSSPKQVLEASDRGMSVLSSSSTQDGVSGDINAAKIAAMNAAELVNRNIVGFGGVGVGHLPADQKRKLLWGNKNNNAAEEASKRWNLNSAPERQERFNKFMGLKGNVALESNVEKDGSQEEEGKKHEEVDRDLEKHYIAGLRRRDGRTVGLGL